MEQTSEQLKTLLGEAEKKLKEAAELNQALTQDNETLNAALNNMMAAQMEEAEQMVQLTEQCWQLEKALEDALKEKDDVMAMVHGLTSGLTDLKDKASEALSRAKTESSRVVLASELQNLASKTLDAAMDEHLAQFCSPARSK